MAWQALCLCTELLGVLPLIVGPSVLDTLGGLGVLVLHTCLDGIRSSLTLFLAIALSGVGRTSNLSTCYHAGHALLRACHGPCGHSRALGCGKYCGCGGFLSLFAQTECSRLIRTIVVPALDLLPLLGVARSCAVPASRMNATWLILPVVICLSQRLSHACVSMN
jgi:hypothetical protein